MQLLRQREYASLVLKILIATCIYLWKSVHYTLSQIKRAKSKVDGMIQRNSM